MKAEFLLIWFQLQIPALSPALPIAHGLSMQTSAPVVTFCAFPQARLWSLYSYSLGCPSLFVCNRSRPILDAFSTVKPPLTSPLTHPNLIVTSHFLFLCAVICVLVLHLPWSSKFFKAGSIFSVSRLHIGSSINS